MAAWTDELKKQAIDAYTGANPTPETSTELIKEIAEDMEFTPNGVRQVLIQAGVYVKKEPAKGGTATKGGTAAKATGDKAPRVSKEDQIAGLKAAIEAKGAEVDEEVLSKLTGKAAAYLTKVLES